MNPIFQHRLRPFGALDLHHAITPGLHLVLAHGRGSRVRVPAHWISLCWPIRGALWLQAEQHEWSVETGCYQLWGQGSLELRAADAQGWLLLAGARVSWLQTDAPGAPDALLLPWQARINRELAHRLFAAARADDASTQADAWTTGDVLESLLRHQADLQALLERCAGRTRHLRQQTMARLLRVRHAIGCDPGRRQDLDHLATLANYSPCHLLRMHRRVFGETPFEYASRLRERRALELVRGTDMSILDVSLRLGFENQSAFCRAFKLTFGATPTELRRHAHEQARQAA